MGSVEIEGPLGDGQCRGAALADFLAPGLDLGIQLIDGHALVRQAHLDSFLAGVAPAHIPDLARLFLADDAGQIVCAEPRIDRSHLWADLSEDRFVRANRQVADRRQHITSADGVPVHAGDHGFGHVANGVVQFFDWQADGTAPVVLSFMCRLIATCTERSVSGTGQDDAPDLPVVTSFLKGIDQLVAGLAAKSVHLFGSVDGDPRNAVFHLVDNVGVVHSVSFHLGRRYPAIVRPPETERTCPVT